MGPSSHEPSWGDQSDCGPAPPQPGSHSELQLLREQNARLRQAQLSYERQIQELRLEVNERHDEELRQRVARHTRETAALVSRHEEEVRRLVSRYEQQLSDASLAAAVPAYPPCIRAGGGVGSGISSGNSGNSFGSRAPLRHTRSLMSEFGVGGSGTALGLDEVRASGPLRGPHANIEQERRRADEAEAVRVELEAKLARYKRQNKKLQRHGTEELQCARDRLRSYALAAAQRQVESSIRLVIFVWRGAVEAASAQSEPHELGSPASAMPAALPMKPPGSRRAEHSGGTSVTRSAWQERVTTSAAMAAAVRLGAAKWTLYQAALLQAWRTRASEARHESLLRDQLDSASLQSMAALRTLRVESQQLRLRGKNSAELSAWRRSLVELAVAFGAWAREALRSGMLARQSQNMRKYGVDAAARPAWGTAAESRTKLAGAAGAARIAALRQSSFLLSALQAWRVRAVEARHAHRVQCQLEEASLHTVVALRNQRAEAKDLRQRGRRCITVSAHRRSLVAVAAPFSAWARLVARASASRHHESMLHCQADEIAWQSTQALAAVRAEARALRLRCRRCAARLAQGLAMAAVFAPFSTWARHVSEQRARGHGDIVLNSGQAARRAQKELRQVRADAKEQAAQGHMKATRCTAFMEARARQDQDTAVRFVTFQCWAKAAVLTRHQSLMQRAATEAERQRASAVECARNSGRSALQQAWEEAAAASRKAAALERQVTSRPSSRCGTQGGWRPATAAGQSLPRPRTAAELEKRLEALAAEASASCAASTVEPTGTNFSSRPSSAQVAREPPQIMLLPDRDHLRSRRRDLILHVIRRQEAQRLALVMEGWAKAVLEMRVLCLAQKERTQAEQVIAARKGRKGIFMAALGLQAKYEVAVPLSSWSRFTLEARCRRKIKDGGSGKFDAAVLHPKLVEE